MVASTDERWHRGARRGRKRNERQTGEKEKARRTQKGSYPGQIWKKPRYGNRADGRKVRCTYNDARAIADGRKVRCTLTARALAEAERSDAYIHTGARSHMTVQGGDRALATSISNRDTKREITLTCPHAPCSHFRGPDGTVPSSYIPCAPPTSVSATCRRAAQHTHCHL